MLCSECTQSVYESVETDTLDSSEECVEIFTSHNWLWTEICLQCRHDIAGICRCRLGRERSGPEECHGFLVQQKQTFVALSTTEAEYIALCVAVHEAVRLCKLLADLFGHEMDSTVIHCDNQSCVKLSENPVFHDKLKHIEIKYHYIRDMVQRKAVHVQYLSTHEQVADVFTKPLARTKFEYFHERLGLVENASLAEREC
jgi:hypothetical protein